MASPSQSSLVPVNLETPCWRMPRMKSGVCLLVSVLQVCDDAVVNVFFLLLDIIFIGILSDVLDSGKRFIRRIFVLQYLYKNHHNSRQPYKRKVSGAAE